MHNASIWHATLTNQSEFVPESALRRVRADRSSGVH